MDKEEYVEFTKEGFQKFVDSLTEYPEEDRMKLAILLLNTIIR